MRALIREWQRARVRRAVHKTLSGQNISIVSSNCVGARLTMLAGEAYRSPTVDLWFPPADFITFVSGIDAYRTAGLVADQALSVEYGYPVAHLGDDILAPRITLYFQHFHTFDDAAATWRRRFERLNYGRMFLVFTDRDGASEADLRRFSTLPHPKVALVARRFAGLADTVQIRGYEDSGHVGDLFSDWHRLGPAVAAISRGVAALNACPHPSS